MKTTLFIVGMCNLIISCTSTHPRTIDLNLIVTAPVNSTETKVKNCDLSEFIDTRGVLVKKSQYAESKDIVGYVKALEDKQLELYSENLSIIKSILKCHSR